MCAEWVGGFEISWGDVVTRSGPHLFSDIFFGRIVMLVVTFARRTLTSHVWMVYVGPVLEIVFRWCLPVLVLEHYSQNLVKIPHPDVLVKLFYLRELKIIMGSISKLIFTITSYVFIIETPEPLYHSIKWLYARQRNNVLSWIEIFQSHQLLWQFSYSNRFFSLPFQGIIQHSIALWIYKNLALWNVISILREKKNLKRTVYTLSLKAKFVFLYKLIIRNEML